MSKRTAFLGALFLASFTASAAMAAEGDTVNAVKQRGEILCGTSVGGSVGMSTLDDKGNWAGLEVDYCRALAAALIGDSTKVKFMPLEFKNAFAALASGSVDLLARTATWTFTRDTEMKFEWAATYLYDGQGFMVRKSLGVASAKELDGASICVTGGRLQN